jgi:uncharacterized protein (TIGR03086 family)
MTSAPSTSHHQDAIREEHRMIDLTPATTTLTEIVAAVRDDQLGAPTPCKGTTVGALLDHVQGLASAFTAAATKATPQGGSRPPSADASRLGTDWRPRIESRLTELAKAWQDESAWTGMTQAGGLDLPGEVAGIVALNEVVVHGWDLSVATGRPFTCDTALVEAARTFVESAVARNPDGTEGLFGPPVAVPDDAPPVDRLIGLTGRDPQWRPDAQR